MSSNVWPPVLTNENANDREARLAAEREAKRISDEIDRALEQERQELRKRRPQTKILLLGQAESGKSTMIKHFQLFFCPSQFAAETEAWRTVIHLNLARFVNHVLQVLSTAGSASGKSDPNVRMLQMRLSPLKQVELILSRAINEESPSQLSSPTEETSKPTWRPRAAPEVSIRGGSGWKTLMRRRKGSTAAKSPSIPDEVEDARQILDACKDDVVALWQSSILRTLEEEGMDLHHHARYFLDNAARVANLSYTPTTDDILRARLRTLGVEEYRMTMETAAEKGSDWVFYDVGGSRNQRAAWASYFDDVNAVIFLCPMSGFNQRLSEDGSVNRLFDSMELWETVCKSKLLANAMFILLLNKADILYAKLKAGIKFEDYVASYHGRPNKAEYVADYLREQMILTHRMCSPKRRQLHAHVTCAIDTTVMGAVLNSIRDCILVIILQQTTLL
ncbi:G-alpha-domain-containing protein [Lentinus tigrinus ALCF2SS1-7]|uniref:G-alpha-domain-containing protein n=1 Tax=Lentinus tigrinus ALCF2SS1-7 TaxID=1328758 RepID=UPI001165CBD9|nr:G-alpha-domain-containing protein [Lentinus tigrinus ALCF2SS1-7]